MPVEPTTNAEPEEGWDSSSTTTAEESEDEEDGESEEEVEGDDGDGDDERPTKKRRVEVRKRMYLMGTYKLISPLIMSHQTVMVIYISFTESNFRY